MGAKSKAFTYIELSVTVLVLALLAALIVPRAASVQNSINAKLSLDAVQRLASRARETALSSGLPVTMAYNETDSQFELRQTSATQETTTLSSVALHHDLSANHFEAGQNEMTATDWTVTFYSDGTSDGGTVEVDEGGILRTLIIGSKTGLSRWQDGATPESESVRWQAGEMERRG